VNARRRLEREIIRHRRSHKHPWAAPVFTRVTMSNGTRVRLVLHSGYIWHRATVTRSDD